MAICGIPMADICACIENRFIDKGIQVVQDSYHIVEDATKVFLVWEDL